MEYLKKSFTVGMPAGEQYRDNWDAIFSKKCNCGYVKRPTDDNLIRIQPKDEWVLHGPKCPLGTKSP